MGRVRLRRFDAIRRSRLVSSFLLTRKNPQHRLRTLERFRAEAEAEEKSEEQIPVFPGQIKLWPM